MAKILEEEEELALEQEEVDNFSSSSCDCFTCIVKQPDARLRRADLAAFFRDLPYCEDDDDVSVLNNRQSCSSAVEAVWRAAMAAPDDPELPSLGAIRCMSLLLSRALADPDWLRRNARVPYFAAHAIGSYTLRSPAHAELAVAAGAVRPLLALLGGALMWVEQRAAARALGHLASYDATFPAVARHAAEAVPFAARAASTCVADVYNNFVALPPARRPTYQRDLLSGLGRRDVAAAGGPEAQERKAEEWASQLQCWSLYLLSCLASRDAPSHAMICQDAVFLRELSLMWGGLANGDSPAGVGLMRILCRSDVGRGAVAASRDALGGLCDLARSSDDWQYMAVDCLLLLLDDRDTWRAVADATASRLVDLVEVRQLGPRKRLGDAIASALLVDVDRVEELGFEAKEAIAEVRKIKVERKEEEEAIMPGDELLRREILAKEKRREGNDRFLNGDVDTAMELYTEALDLCPLSRRTERLVLYSNRAQCRLARRDADAAASDATRALALARPANAHARSLWRRAQAYDMKSMARESLLDCLAFAGAWLDRRRRKRRPARGVNPKLPYCVARMISKQMSVTGLFATMAKTNGDKQLAAGGGGGDRMLRCSDDEDDGDNEDDPDDGGSEEDLSDDGLKIYTSG
ncbi:hypothetical protein PR202_gb18974 [Eleusine coracana subsp. coracana]|uniref:ARM repeat N-terminal plant domain-containing protein n=1 Tax=Eleusine coracana subsp. coracana TaxID=191504 RepID=A0AAV5F6Z8_ELECO|nr:hypothetical protein PR202_gb18974 [Eleusine coracana subsp. coracana]